MSFHSKALLPSLPLALSLALLLAVLGTPVAEPAQAAIGDLLLESCLASESNLTGVVGCEDITANTDQARGFQSVVPNHDGDRVYAVVAGTVHHFERAANGSLGFASCITSIDAATGCENLDGISDSLRGSVSGVLSPDGRHFYVASFLEDAVTQLQVRADGSLGFVNCWSTDGAFGCTDLSGVSDSLASATSVTVSPDGSSVYVGDSQANAGAITHFRRGNDGALTFAGCWSSEGVFGCTDLSAATTAVTGIARMVISPDGHDLYAGTDGSDAVVHFARNPVNGNLTVMACATSDATETGCTLLPTNALQDVDHEAVAMSADGRSLYVSGRPRNAIVRFSRDTTTGALTFEDCLFRSGATNGCIQAGTATGGFRFIESLAVSPDGLNLYAAAFGHDAVLQLDRDPSTGALTRPRCLSSNTPSNNECTKVFEEGSLSEAMTVAVSPDNQSVYLGSSDALVHLERETNECVSDDETLCLNDDRFEVKVTWRGFDSEVGRGMVVPFGSNDSGLMWFFQPDNWEELIKVLDGCDLNGHFWVFVAAVTNVEYTITVRDVVTGERKEYFNPLGNPAPATTDTEAFATCPDRSTSPAPRLAQRGELAGPVRIHLDRLADYPHMLTEAAHPLLTDVVDTSAENGATNCTDSDTVMCLNQERFRVEVDWRDFGNDTGPGRVVPFGSDDSGLYYFFEADNWEMLVKVLDGCALTDHFWVFAAATTNVEYTLTVTDTETGAEASYFNPLGTAAAAITDTAAFATCPD